MVVHTQGSAPLAGAFFVNKKIRVLQLQYRYNVSASDLGEQIVQGLPPDRFEVTTAFLCGRPGPNEQVSRAQRSVYFDFSRSGLSGLRLRVLKRLYQFCTDERFDVVIAHRFKPINIMMLLNGWLNIPTCIGVQHRIGDFDRRYRRWQTRYLMGPNWRMVGVSRAVREYLLACGAGFTSENTVQINNAIDIAQAERLQHNRASARQMLGLAPGAFIFGTIGRLVPVKGHRLLIEAFARIHQRHPHAMVTIIGEGRSRPELEAAIAHHNLEDRVILLGAREDALQYVRAYDVFVMPSLSEGLPLALLEGMSARLPIIASDIDSMRSIVQDCGGWLFQSANVEDLAEKLDEVLRLPPPVLQDAGEHAYRYLRKEHDIDQFRRQYRDLISSNTGDQ